MSSWVLSIVGVILLTSVVGIIMPEGKMGLFIKGLLAIISTLVIIQPVINFYSKGFDIEETLNEYDIGLQDDFLYFIQEKRIEEYENHCLDILSDNGIENGKISVEAETSDNRIIIKKVRIDLSDSVINHNEEHINILTSIISEVANYLNIEEELIEIDE